MHEVGFVLSAQAKGISLPAKTLVKNTGAVFARTITDLTINTQVGAEVSVKPR